MALITAIAILPLNVTQLEAARRRWRQSLKQTEQDERTCVGKPVWPQKAAANHHVISTALWQVEKIIMHTRVLQ